MVPSQDHPQKGNDDNTVPSEMPQTVHQEGRFYTLEPRVWRDLLAPCPLPGQKP